MIGLGGAEALVLLMIPLALAGTALWIWMIVDCASNEIGPGDDRLIWILVIVFTGWIGALIYLIVRRQKRKALLGR
jgi:hypothetical protein